MSEKHRGEVGHTGRLSRRNRLEPGLGELLLRLRELSDAGTSSAVSDREIDLVIEELTDRISARSFADAVYEELYIEVTRVGPTGADAASRAVVTATGLDARGDPEPLGFAAGGDHELVGLCRDLLLDLRWRGVRRVGLVRSSAETGVTNVVPWVFPGSFWVELPAGKRPPWLDLPPDGGGDPGVD